MHQVGKKTIIILRCTAIYIYIYIYIYLYWGVKTEYTTLYRFPSGPNLLTHTTVSGTTSPAPRTHLLIKPTSEQFSAEQYTSFGIDRVSGTPVTLTPHRACKWATECSVLSAGVTQSAKPLMWGFPHSSAKRNGRQLTITVACDLKLWLPVKKKNTDVSDKRRHIPTTLHCVTFKKKKTPFSVTTVENLHLHQQPDDYYNIF